VKKGKIQRRFRFEKAWNKKEVAGVIKQVWRAKHGRLTGWDPIIGKLNKSRSSLLKWVKLNKDPSEADLRATLAKVEEMHVGEGAWDVTGIKQMQEKAHNLMEMVDSKWRQRAKEVWLTHGDRNSKYFHACASQQRRNNLISSIIDSEGVKHESEAGIEGAFMGFFDRLFTSSNPYGLETCLQTLPMRVTNEMNSQLLGKVMKEEVHQALLQMAPLKSPRPDGFPAAFYQHHWNLVEEEVVTAVREFFNNGCIDPDINFTHIALVPKKKNPVGVSDFRPISLFNVVYKILSKVLANRLKYILPVIISCNQSAFIPGRLISDNIIAAYETLHTMHSRMYGRVGYMTVKLDMSKAYDRVEWSFLKKVLKKLGFEN
jgi:hypothetical protein